MSALIKAGIGRFVKFGEIVKYEIGALFQRTCRRVVSTHLSVR